MRIKYGFAGLIDMSVLDQSPFSGIVSCFERIFTILISFVYYKTGVINLMKKKPQVIDFFCGAGGFSEGFRQQGFDIVMGIDNWLPAIQTHNLNHNLNDSVKDILDFMSVKAINTLPNVEVLVGSPPCVLFSLSNKGGKADKTLGIRLIESFLRVVAVKKHQSSSNLVAWFMENVPNSKNYIRLTYTFRQLNLTKWAKEHGFNPNQVALNGSINGRVLNTADFGVSQKRQRFVCGEIVSTGKFPDLTNFTDKASKCIGTIKELMPPPNSPCSNNTHTDPNYPSLKLKMNLITDNFYDSGIYESQWKNAQSLKLNHPFMGKMSFPENEQNPSRTIMATQSASTREALIYQSEYKRKGNGEFRLPTIREIATIMSFPYTYQFSGGESTKWRQVGNAVCPFMSATLAKSVRLEMGLRAIPDSKIRFEAPDTKMEKIYNLNTFAKREFDTPPKKKANARFRRHPFKDGNMTIALTNYHPIFSSKISKKWYSSIFFGSGKDFKVRVIPKSRFKKIGKLIEAHQKDLGIKFIKEFNRKFKWAIGISGKFQDAYVRENTHLSHEPSRLIDKIREFILGLELVEKQMKIPEFVPEKEEVPIRQVMAMYAINRLVS